MIGIYAGSFDPFHKGHLAICSYLLREKQDLSNTYLLKKLYILPNIPNKKKGNRSSLSDRIKIIEYELETLSNDLLQRIVVSPDDADSVVTSIKDKDDNHIVLILGSDRYFYYLNKNELNNEEHPKIDCHSYIIIQRFGSNDKFIENSLEIRSFCDKPCYVLIDVPDQDTASTNVRFGDYSNRAICDKSIQYIQSHGLYEKERIVKAFPEFAEFAEFADFAEKHIELYRTNGISGNSVTK